MSKQNKPKAVVFYHDNCVDGKMAAYVTYLGLLARHYASLESGEEILCLPVQYGKPLPVIPKTVTVVYIVDFSFPTDVIEKMAQEMKDNWTNLATEQNSYTALGHKVMMIDHHETALNNMGGYPLVDRGRNRGMMKCCENHLFSVLIDTEKSGAALAFDEFFDDLEKNYMGSEMEALAEIVDAVDDRDRWVFRLKDTEAIYEYLVKSGILTKPIGSFKEFIPGFGTIDTDAYLRELDLCQERVNMRLELAQAVADKAKTLMVDGLKVAMVNCPSFLASMTGDILARTHDYAIMYVMIGDDSIIFSLRANANNTINVARIAEANAGGGHPKAAGYKAGYTHLSYLFSCEVKK